MGVRVISWRQLRHMAIVMNHSRDRVATVVKAKQRNCTLSLKGYNLYERLIWWVTCENHSLETPWIGVWPLL